MNSGNYNGLEPGLRAGIFNGERNGCVNGLQGNQTKNQIVVVKDRLVIDLDATDAASYPGTGATWVNLTGNPNGTLANSPAYIPANGGNIKLNGVNQTVSIAHNAAFNFGAGDFSYGMWVYVPYDALTATKEYGLLTKAAGYQGVPGFVCEINTYTAAFLNGKKVTLDCWNTQASFQTNNIATNIDTNRWVFFMYTRKESLVRLYVNGKLRLERTFPTNADNVNNTSNIIMGYVTWPINYSTINIGRLLVYSKALTMMEVVQNYNASKNKYEI